jgi:hypothetical protein
MRWHEINAIYDLAMLLAGVIYAFCGSTSVSVNGRVMPSWISFMLRLCVPAIMFGMAMIAKV